MPKLADVLITATRCVLLSALLGVLCVSPYHPTQQQIRPPTTCEGAVITDAVWLPPTCALHLGR